jgi:hypothetical protein
MFLTHSTYVTATEIEQMGNAVKLVKGLGIEANGCTQSMKSVCVWLVRGWDSHNDKHRAVVVNTITREARDATADEEQNGVDYI